MWNVERECYEIRIKIPECFPMKCWCGNVKVWTQLGKRTQQLDFRLWKWIWKSNYNTEVQRFHTWNGLWSVRATSSVQNTRHYGTTHIEENPLRLNLFAQNTNEALSTRQIFAIQLYSMDNQQMQLYAVNFIPLLGSLYMYGGVLYTHHQEYNFKNCIYSHWHRP